MTTNYFSKIGNETTSREMRGFARAMDMAWPSAEAMKYDLEDLPPLLEPQRAPISVSSRTCQNWRNGTTEPSASQARTIKKLILQQLENQIKAAQAGINLLQ